MNIKFFATLLDEEFSQSHKLSHYVFLLWKHEWNIGKVGEQNWGVVHSHVLLLTHHIFNDLSNDVKREEYIVELSNTIVRFQVRSYLFDDLADVS